MKEETKERMEEDKVPYGIECPKCGRTVDAMKGGNCICGQKVDEIG